MIAIITFTILAVFLLIQTYSNIHIENRYSSNQFFVKLFSGAITSINQQELNVKDHINFMVWIRQKLEPLTLKMNKTQISTDDTIFLPLEHTAYLILKSSRITQIRTNPSDCRLKQKCNNQQFDTRDLSCKWEKMNNNSDCKNWSSFKYEKHKIFEMPEYGGVFTTYEKNGYMHVIDLINNLEENLKDFHNLIVEEKWIDNYTQALIFELNCYNPNSNIWNIIHVSSENSGFGPVLTKVKSRNYLGEYVSSNSEHDSKMDKYKDSMAITRVIVLYLDVYFMLIILYAVHEGTQLFGLVHKYGIIIGIKKYLSSLENLLDWAIIILSVMIESCRIYQKYILVELNKLLLKDIKEHKYLTFSAIAWIEDYLIELNTITVFLVFVKALNLLKCNRKTYLITETIKKESAGLFSLILLVFVNFCVLGIVGFVWFHGDQQFASIPDSIMTALLSTVKHLNFDNLIETKLIQITNWMSIAWYIAHKISLAFILSVIISQLRIVREELRKSPTELLSSKLFSKIIDYFNVFRSFEKEK
jgi:hypothetical protein